MPPHYQRCGQYTFYFPRCSHATSHLYHRSDLYGGLRCSKNCSYSFHRDLWFYASPNTRCSYCGLGPERGFGTKQPLPSSKEDKEMFLEGLMRRGMMGESSGMYHACFREVANQYNLMIDDVEFQEKKKKEGGGDILKRKRDKKQRWQDRKDVRTFRAKRRSSKWIENIRKEQEQAAKEHMELGWRPYIIAEKSRQDQDLLKKVYSLPEPVDICALCQYALNETQISGFPHVLVCRHMFHYDCIMELFKRRKDDEENEVWKCPLCNTWYRDVREIPDFSQRYKDSTLQWVSDAESSGLSENDAGKFDGDEEPPWFPQDRKGSWDTEMEGVVDQFPTDFTRLPEGDTIVVDSQRTESGSLRINPRRGGLAAQRQPNLLSSIPLIGAPLSNTSTVPPPSESRIDPAYTTITSLTALDLPLTPQSHASSPPSSSHTTSYHDPLYNSFIDNLDNLLWPDEDDDLELGWEALQDLEEEEDEWHDHDDDKEASLWEVEEQLDRQIMLEMLNAELSRRDTEEEIVGEREEETGGEDVEVEEDRREQETRDRVSAWVESVENSSGTLNSSQTLNDGEDEPGMEESRTATITSTAPKVRRSGRATKPTKRLIEELMDEDQPRRVRARVV